MTTTRKKMWNMSPKYEPPEVEDEIKGLPSCTAAWGCVANFLPQSGAKSQSSPKEFKIATFQK